MKTFLLTISLAIFKILAFGQTNVPSSQLSSHQSDSVTTSDKIYGGRIVEINHITLLYLGGQFPDQLFTVQIKDPARTKLNIKHPDDLKGRKCKITGKVVELGGKPSFILTDPKQITFD